MVLICVGRDEYRINQNNFGINTLHPNISFKHLVLNIIYQSWAIFGACCFGSIVLANREYGPLL